MNITANLIWVRILFRSMNDVLDSSCGLTFDWDDIQIEDEKVVSSLNKLVQDFGTENVWYRISSSGTGLHILVGELVLDKTTGHPQLTPIPMSVEEQMKHRIEHELECRGRRISDSYRKRVGMRTSRVFQNKNGKSTGEWIKWVVR